MIRTIDYLIMDPEGNITILVLTETDRRDYQKVAQVLLDACPEAEQVGYILPEGEGLPRMEMCGLEFCGNATRSFAFYEALRQDPPLKELDVDVSGCDQPLHAWIDAENRSSGTVRIQMPVPTEIEDVQIPIPGDIKEKLGCDELDGQLVHMDGISHLIISSIDADTSESLGRELLDRLFGHLRDHVYKEADRDIPAFGVMFADPEAGRMTPIVYVRDVDTVYFEGSCASGSTAAAYALAVRDLRSADACMYHLKQPAGTLHIDVTGKDGKVHDMQLYGGVGMSEVKHLELEDGAVS